MNLIQKGIRFSYKGKNFALTLRACVSFFPPSVDIHEVFVKRDTRALYIPCVGVKMTHKKKDVKDHMS